MPPIKKLLAWFVVILLGYAIMTEPVKAADSVGGLLSFAFNGVRNMGIFLGAVIHRIG